MSNQPLQGYGPPLTGYSQPLQGYSQPLQGNNQPLGGNNPLYMQQGVVNPVQVIPGTNMISMNPVVTGNAGNIYIDPRNPRIARDSRGLSGYICEKCQRGILLVDLELVRKGHGGTLLMLSVCFPCICCYLYSKKRKCTSCNEEFPNTCC